MMEKVLKSNRQMDPVEKRRKSPVLLNRKPQTGAPEKEGGKNRGIALIRRQEKLSSQALVGKEFPPGIKLKWEGGGGGRADVTAQTEKI